MIMKTTRFFLEHIHETHMYWAVDYDIIWHVVTSEVPVLNNQVETLLASL